MFPWVAAVPVVGVLFLGLGGAVLSGLLAIADLLVLVLLHVSGHEFPRTIVGEWQSHLSVYSAARAAIFITGILLCHLSLYRLLQRRLNREFAGHQETAQRYREARDAAN